MQPAHKPTAQPEDMLSEHHSKTTLMVAFSCRYIIILLSIAILLLLLAHIGSYVVQPYVGSSIGEALDSLFNVSRENNFPSYFSAFLLLVAALLLYGIYLSVKTTNSSWRYHWRLLSFVMFFLSVDEAVQLHERLTTISGRLLERFGLGFLWFAWVVPYTILFLAVGAYFLRFVLALPVRTRNLFVVSGLLYVGGALGFEFLEGHEVSKNGFSFTYWLMVTVEEVMEMAGVVVLIYALLQLLQQSKAGFRIQQ